MRQLDYKKQILRHARRVVIKIGSQILSSPAGIEEGRFKTLARDLASLHNQKKDIIVVSSGAVAAGMTRLGVKERPKTIPQKQALAAVGQRPVPAAARPVAAANPGRTRSGSPRKRECRKGQAAAR